MKSSSLQVEKYCALLPGLLHAIEVPSNSLSLNPLKSSISLSN